MPTGVTVSSRCILCDGEGRPLFEKHGHAVAECASCGHRFLGGALGGDHVARVYGDDYFEGGGAGYPDYLSEGELIRARGRRYARILARRMAPGRLLDVGAAAGFFLKGFTDQGWQGMGLEPNRRMAEHARRELGLEVEVGVLEGLEAKDSFDLVSMVQVIAHLRDPLEALARAAAATRPGGHWLIETWDRASWTARLLGRRWPEYSPPSVVRWFTPEEMRRLAGRFGLEEVARGRLVKWLKLSHARSLLLHELDGSWWGRLAGKALRLVPGGLTVPYPSEDLFWALFRKL